MFQQLLEELRKVREDMAKKINDVKKLQEKVNRLTAENEALKEEIANHECPVCDHSALEQEIVNLKEQVLALEEEKANHVCPDHKEEIDALEQEIVDLKQQIADHVCSTCNHEEEIEVLKAQVTSIQAEKEKQAKQHEEELASLQAEIDELKKLLATS